MYVRDKRNLRAGFLYTVNRFYGVHIRDGDPDDIAAGLFKSQHLRRRTFCVGSLNISHRLDGDRCVTAYKKPSDLYFTRMTSNFIIIHIILKRASSDLYMSQTP